jgi:DNA-binding CsgD family transcriptional regulator
MGAVGTGCVRLLERDAELARLVAALGRARDGLGGSVVLVSGEAGIGKTSLLREFGARAGPAARVLAEDLSTPRALGPFRDMFRDGGLAAPPDHTDRDRWIDALLRELGAGDRPVVVLLDDAHWADDATLDVLRYVGRRVERLAAVLVVAFRDGLDEEHPLTRVVGAFTSAGTVRLALPPLSDAAVAGAALAAGVEPAAVVGAVGGNPFYLQQALAGVPGEVPASVRDAVLGRLRGLPAGTRRVLEALSVLPSGADLPLLCTLTSPAPGDLAPAERIGMLTLDNGRARFRHELARRAVEGALAASRRIDLNAHILRALEAAGAEPSRLVHHAAAAGDRAAVARLAPVAAAEAAAAEAHRETVAFARLALEYADLVGAPAQARLHGLAGYALYVLNRFGEAAAHATAAVQGWHRLADPAEHGRALLLSARMRTMLGDSAAARSEIAIALAVLEPLGASPDLAYAYGLAGHLDALEADCRSAVDWCDRSLAAAVALDRPDVQAHALMYRGIARVGLGDLAGLTELRSAVGLASRIQHGDFLCRAAHNTAVVLLWQGRHPEALPYLDLAEEAARDHGYDYHLFHVQTQRSHVELFMGQWERAERRLRAELAPEEDPAAVLALRLSVLGRIRVRRGEAGGAELVSRAWSLAIRSRQVYRIAAAGAAQAEAAWLRGDRAAVRAMATPLLAAAARANLVYLRGELMRYLARCGEPAEPFDGCPPGFALALAGDWAGAAAAWAVAGNPYEQALELTESPDRHTALDGLRRLDELGATAAAALVRRNLRRRGVQAIPRGPQPATRGNPAGLTTRQLAVLTLLADGLTSGEVADRMYLSRRTVDNHVTAILARLGVPSRRTAVALATERGWLAARTRN